MASKIIKNLYLGSVDDRDLKKYDLNIDLSYPINDVSNKGVKKDQINKCNVISIGLNDRLNTRIDKTFKPLCLYIDKYLKDDKRVLVNCIVGKSRSPSVVIAYLMWKYGLSLKEALKYVKERRGIVDPNPGFIKKLEQWQEYLNNKN